MWASASTPIELENARTGSATWQLTNPAEYGEIEGYASLTSVNRGKAIKLFVNTQEPFYTIEIYRMGWYGGACDARPRGTLAAACGPAGA